jgi:hypothetical protein
MKIRIKSNELRYRLTRPDVKQLAETDYLEDKIDFGEASLTYAIRLTGDKQLSSVYKDDTITLFMPENMATELQNTDRVGFENYVNGLHLLVEKDFTCLDNAAEDQSDNYPNPMAAGFYEEGD